MENNGYRVYRDQSVNEMSQNELLLLLYDELVKRLTRAQLALNKTDYDLMDQCIERSLAILRYLDDTLDMQYAISMDLRRMYDFLSYDLQRVKAGRNKIELERVRRMACELRDSFRAAEKNSESGK